MAGLTDYSSVPPPFRSSIFFHQEYCDADIVAHGLHTSLKLQNKPIKVVLNAIFAQRRGIYPNI